MPPEVLTVLDTPVLPAASVAVARTLMPVCGMTSPMLRAQLEPPPDIAPEPEVEPDHDSVTDPMPPASDTEAV